MVVWGVGGGEAGRQDEESRRPAGEGRRRACPSLPGCLQALCLAPQLSRFPAPEGKPRPLTSPSFSSGSAHTHPARLASTSLLPASQSLHFLTLLLGSPQSRGGWGRELCPNVTALHALPAAIHTISGLTEIPKALVIPLSNKHLLRPWGTQVTRTDAALAFSDQLLGVVVVGCILVGLEVVTACSGSPSGSSDTFVQVDFICKMGTITLSVSQSLTCPVSELPLKRCLWLSFLLLPPLQTPPNLTRTLWGHQEMLQALET